MGILNYYLKRNPEHRDKNLIEKQTIKKENELINLRNTERKIEAQHKKNMEYLRTNWGIGPSNSFSRPTNYFPQEFHTGDSDSE